MQRGWSCLQAEDAEAAEYCLVTIRDQAGEITEIRINDEQVCGVMTIHGSTMTPFEMDELAHAAKGAIIMRDTLNELEAYLEQLVEKEQLLAHSSRLQYHLRAIGYALSAATDWSRTTRPGYIEHGRTLRDKQRTIDRQKAQDLVETQTEGE